MRDYLINKMSITKITIILLSMVGVYILVHLISANDMTIKFNDFQHTNINYFIANNLIALDEKIVAYKNLDQFDDKYALIVTNKKLYIFTKNYHNKILFQEIKRVNINKIMNFSVLQLITDRIAVEVTIENYAVEQFLTALGIKPSQVTRIS